MERILTNYQVEWLVNIKLLLEYSDASFEIYENVKKYIILLKMNIQEKKIILLKN